MGGWSTLDETKSTPTLFQEFDEKETLITNELKLAAPWGYAGIDQVVEAQDPGLRRLLSKALPRFHRSVSVSTCFQRYRA